MSLLSIVLLAIALSIDAGVVSFAHGLIFEKNKLKNALLLGSYTGGFQALMPLLGYFLTKPFQVYFEPIGKWIVFVIFMYLGIKVIQESFEEERGLPTCLSFKCLFFVAIATSIDALAAGITLALNSVNIYKAILIIGCTTFIFAVVGYFCGCWFKKLSTKWLEAFAGLILVFLAIKSLF